MSDIQQRIESAIDRYSKFEESKYARDEGGKFASKGENRTPSQKYDDASQSALHGSNSAREASFKAMKARHPTAREDGSMGHMGHLDELGGDHEYLKKHKDMESAHEAADYAGVNDHKSAIEHHEKMAEKHREYARPGEHHGDHAAATAHDEAAEKHREAWREKFRQHGDKVPDHVEKKAKEEPDMRLEKVASRAAHHKSHVIKMGFGKKHEEAAESHEHAAKVNHEAGDHESGNMHEMMAKHHREQSKA